MINLKITNQGTILYLCLLPNDSILIRHPYPKKLKFLWNSGANSKFIENIGLERNMLNYIQRHNEWEQPRIWALYGKMALCPQEINYQEKKNEKKTID